MWINFGLVVKIHGICGDVRKRILGSGFELEASNGGADAECAQRATLSGLRGRRERVLPV